MKAYWKTVFRSIKNSFARFAAILAIIALGVGFYSGLSLTMPCFLKTGDRFVGDHDLYDLRLISTIGFDDEDIEMMGTLLGHTVTSGEMVRKSSDAAPYVGLGRIVTKMVGGAYKYKVEFLSKVKFKEPSQEDNTKGDNLEFGTTEIEGSIATLADGTWSKAQTFDTLSAAQTYLNGLFT